MSDMADSLRTWLLSHISVTSRGFAPGCGAEPEPKKLESIVLFEDKFPAEESRKLESSVLLIPETSPLRNPDWSVCIRFDPAVPRKLESIVFSKSGDEAASASSSADGVQRPDCSVLLVPSMTELPSSGGIREPPPRSTTVGELRGVDSDDSTEPKLIVAAPISLTVNSRPQDGQLGGDTSLSSNV